MVDRQLVYIGQIPQDTDQLNQNKNTMIGLGYALQAILGTSTALDGLACTSTGPATLTVNVAPGSIYSLQNVDATAYGSLAADTTHQTIKQGIVNSTTNFSTPAPVTVGQSVVYLIQAAYQDTDSGSTVLPYYNASNPSVAWSGPSNSGVSQNTVRQGVCTLSLKTGTPATTGTQVTPTADAGYVGLWAITVANGQSTVTSGNIIQLTTASFIATKLPAVLAAIQSGTTNYAADTSVSANTLTVALTPAVASLTAGLRVLVKVANTNTGAVVMNTNSLGNVAVVSPNGSALSAGALAANGVYQFAYDANGTRWQVQNAAINPTGYFFGTTSGGSANAQTLATVTPSGFTLSQGNAVAFTAGFTNTGAMTMNVNSTGASAVNIDTGSGPAALTGGEIVLNNDYVIYWDGTRYLLIDPSTLAFLNSPALTGNPTAPTATVNDNSTKIATTAYADRAATNAKAYVGGAFSETGAVATGMGTFTINDTIPTNTNGDQYMSVTYTPTNASNKLIIDVYAICSNSVTGSDLGMALFQDSTANALAATIWYNSSNSHMWPQSMRHEMTAGTTSSTTFKVRIGGSSGTTTFNGISAARNFGGVLASSIRVTEVTS